MMRKLNGIFKSIKVVQEGNCCLAPGNGGKHTKASNKKQNSALLDCAEEFCQKLNTHQEIIPKECMGKKLPPLW